VSCLSDSKGLLRNCRSYINSGGPRWTGRKGLGVPKAYPHSLNDIIITMPPIKQITPMNTIRTTLIWPCVLVNRSFCFSVLDRLVSKFWTCDSRIRITSWSVLPAYSSLWSSVILTVQHNLLDLIGDLVWIKHDLTGV